MDADAYLKELTRLDAPEGVMVDGQWFTHQCKSTPPKSRNIKPPSPRVFSHITLCDNAVGLEHLVDYHITPRPCLQRT
jgi:hypothetical protein